MSADPKVLLPVPPDIDAARIAGEVALRRALAAANENATSIPEELILVTPQDLYFALPQIFTHAPDLQRRVLQEILRRSQGSQWAHANDMEGITPDEWLAHAPVTAYEDYRPFIEAEVAGDSRMLFNAPVDAIIATTGSTGQQKHFLESRAGTMAKLLIMRVRGMYMRIALPITGDMEAKNLTISNYAPVGKSASGIEIVRASGQTARNMRKKTGTMNILPEAFWMAPDLDPDKRDYMMGAYALGEERFSKVFCNNLIHFGRILDRIERDGQRMVGDVRRGCFDVAMGEETAAALAASFPARPNRAAELEAVLARRGTLVGTPAAIAETWPGLRMVSSWMSASVGRDAREVLRRLPKRVRAYEMGYGSSEAKLAIPLHGGTASGACAPFSQFYEFLPLNAEPGTRPLGMHEVRADAYYELIVTTYSGLYRYNMNDVVSIDGFEGATPLITFCGKSTEFVTCNGRRIYSCHFAELAEQVEKELGVQFDVMQVLPAGGSWYWVLEAKGGVDFAAVLAALDARARQLWGATSKGVYVMSHNYKNRRFTELTRPDRGACGIKLPLVLKDPPAPRDVERIVRR